ncbi:MAG: hypothetical protein HY062_01610 [Bacteroidetes bacterium]|nr:hypothetical protein [Bacteroidota bacterium]
MRYKLNYFILFFVSINTILFSQTIATYSILSTGYDRINHTFYTVPTSGSVANFDPNWYVNRKQDVIWSSPIATPIAGSTVVYSPSPLAYIIYPGAMNNSGVNALYINKNSTSSSESATNIMTYRTYFNLPAILPTNKQYSIVVKTRSDDISYGVGLNGVDINSGISFYQTSPGVYVGGAYSGNPAVLTIPYGSPNFVGGTNYIEITAADLGLSVTGICAEVILYEQTLPCKDW